MDTVQTTATESFIPVSKFALLDYLKNPTHWDQADGHELERVFSYLLAWRHELFRERLNGLKEAYLPFSPDRDTLRVMEYEEEQLSEFKQTLKSHLADLLTRANFERLTRHDIETIFQENNQFGLELKVDLSEFDDMMLFARGSTSITQSHRSWRTLFLKHHVVEIPTYQRLFLLLKLKPEAQRIEEIMGAEEVSEKKAGKLLKKYRKNLPEQAGSEYIYLKLFKNIPKIELEMLFPNTSVGLKPFDKLKLGVTAGGGTGASVFATATKLTAAANPLAAAGAVAGLGGVIFRQVTKVISQRNKYMMLLAQKLFFHNLANNRGVLTLLVDRAEEEDVKEALLTYYFVCNGDYPADDLEKLSADVEFFLQEHFGAVVDFDGAEAVQRLIDDGLINVEDKRLLAMQPQDASQHLEKRWIEGLGKASDPDSADQTL